MEPSRRVVVGLTVAAFVLIGVGVATLVFDSGFSGGGGATISHAATTSLPPSSPQTTVSPAPSTTPSPGSGGSGTPAPGLSASPTVSASPSGISVGFSQQGDTLVYRAADGTVIPAPAVPGLEVRLVQGRAIYYALAGNRYSLKTGSYAGEFKPLVTMGQPDGSSAETGGVVLAGLVVSRMISDTLAPMPADAGRWIVALPVDIRTATSVVSVTFDQFGLAGWSNTPRVVVSFPGSLPVVEIIPANQGFHVLDEELGVSAWQIIDPKRLSLPTDVIDPAHPMSELLIYGDGTATIPGQTGPLRDALFDRKAGDPYPVGSLMLSATTDVSVSLVVDGSRQDLGPDKVLTVGDVPVFVARS